jgi:uncharacterized membrane protein YoaK (UPF0700 family)
MSVLSGVVDAVSILSLGRVFVANMTGNLAFVGFAIGGGSGFSIGTTLVALAGFTVGVLTYRAWPAERSENRVATLRDGAATETVLLGAATLAVGLAGPHLSVPLRDAVVGVAAVALGLQNGLVDRLAVPYLTTTTLTRSLVGLLRGVGGHPAAWRQAAGIACLLAGAIVGAALVVGVGRTAALGLATALTAGVATSAAVLRRRPAPWAA